VLVMAVVGDGLAYMLRGFDGNQDRKTSRRPAQIQQIYL
jgi:hypothetical protein